MDFQVCQPQKYRVEHHFKGHEMRVRCIYTMNTYTYSRFVYHCKEQFLN